MASIIVTRSNEYMNKLRSIGIYIDGEKVCVLRNGAYEKLEVDEGKHTLNACIDWCGSNKLDFIVVEGEEKHFKLGGFKGARRLLVLLNIMLLCLIANLFVDQPYLLYTSLTMAGIMMLVLLYKFTIGRNTYLYLEQTN